MSSSAPSIITIILSALYSLGLISMASRGTYRSRALVTIIIIPVALLRVILIGLPLTPTVPINILTVDAVILVAGISSAKRRPTTAV